MPSEICHEIEQSLEDRNEKPEISERECEI